MSTAEQLTTGPLWTPQSMGNPACAEGCGEPVARPYSAQRKLTSVTTLIDKMSKEGLQWGAAKETAIFAVDHQADWRDLDRDDAIERLRTHFRGVWDRSADVGTLTHSVNEAWCEGREWDPDADVERLVANKRIKQADHLPELMRRLDGYVDGLERFWLDCKPVTVATEVPVRKPGRWIGTADWIADLNGERYLLDLKTTSELDPDKGVYLDSWRPQLAAYFHSDEVVHFHGKTEVASWPIEDCFARPTRAGIIHLRGDGGYQLIEVDVQAPLTQAVIDACAVLHQWGLKGGHATPAPVIVAEHHREKPAPRPDAPASPGMLG